MSEPPSLSEHFHESLTDDVVISDISSGPPGAAGRSKTEDNIVLFDQD